MKAFLFVAAAIVLTGLSALAQAGPLLQPEWPVQTESPPQAASLLLVESLAQAGPLAQTESPVQTESSPQAASLLLVESPAQTGPLVQTELPAQAETPAQAASLVLWDSLAQAGPLAQPEPSAQTESPAQAPAPPPQSPSARSRFAAALSYQVQRSNAPPAVCDCFVLQGLRAEFSYSPSKLPEKLPEMFHHFSGVFEFGGGHVSNIRGNGLDLSLVTYLIGPRYSTNAGHKLKPFAQVLLGGVHGFDSVFPRRTGFTPSANSFALAAGVGVDLELSTRFSVRLLQIDYLKTSLPNGASNGQNNLRVGAGIVVQLEPLPKPPPKGHPRLARLKAMFLHLFGRNR